MIQHSMNVVNDSVQFLNPGQIPILVMDQPLLAIAKSITFQPSMGRTDSLSCLVGPTLKLQHIRF